MAQRKVTLRTAVIAVDTNLLADDTTVWDRCLELADRGAVAAGRWYDARIAAACLAHGVRELWTVDRDYSRFPELTVRNPLLAAP